MKTLLFLFLILLPASSGICQERYVRPVDEAGKDKSFLAFRGKLAAAAERRDAKAILAAVDPEIKNGFEGTDGIAWFKKLWKLPGKQSNFWKEFLKVIKNGGSFDGKSGTKLFRAPYTFSNWPDNIDGFEYYAVFGNNVNLRETPSMNGRVIGRLSHNAVSVDHRKSVMNTAPKEEDRAFIWYKVKTLGGMEGFVSAEFIRSHLDYRAGFEKKRGQWKMTFFLAGD